MRKVFFFKTVGVIILFFLFVVDAVVHATDQNTGNNDPDSRELIILLGIGPAVPTPEQVVQAGNIEELLPFGLMVGNPVKVRFGLAKRAQGETLRWIITKPDSPRALLERYIVLTYPTPINLTAIKRILEENPFIMNVEENLPGGFSGTPPSDPFYSQQWGLSTLNLPLAWDYTKGHAYVGMVDTGIQVDHEDLRSFNPLSGSYEGGNFRSQFSYDYGQRINDVNESYTYKGHGTHVAGIIAATSNNGIGVTGTCWHCSMMVGKLLPSYYSDTIANAYSGLVDTGAQVINQSGFINNYSCSNDYNMVCQALAHADENDVAIFAASGNDAKNSINFPAKDYRVIAVGGIQQDGAFWKITDPRRPECINVNPDTGVPECGSNYGTEQALVAPAAGILSTFYTGAEWYTAVGCADLDGNGYDLCTGTSMSSPYAAAIGGIIRGVNPLLSKYNVRDILTSYTDRNNGTNPLFIDPTGKFGYGIPDATEAVKATLGKVGGIQLQNRLTPLFSLYSAAAEDHFYTTVPQMALAAINGTLQPQPQTCSVSTTTNCTSDTDCPGGEICIHHSVSYYPIGAATPGYSGLPCNFSPCPPLPKASVYIFTTENSPLAGAPPLVSLYRLSYQGNFTGNNPSHIDHTYTTEQAGIDNFTSIGYKLDGIEGYIYPRSTSPQPASTVRLFRKYNSTRDDHAIFPESELAAMAAQGYTQNDGDDWIGYVYPNIDTDQDGLIDGFEQIIGTCLTKADTNSDGTLDGAFMVQYSNATHSYKDPGQCGKLHIGKSGSGSGTVTSLPEGINCGLDCDEEYVMNTVVTLTATPDGNSTFTSWSGGGCSGAGTCQVTPSGVTNVTSTFILNQYTVTATATGNGSGTVTSNAGGISYTYPTNNTGTSGAINYGTSVVLTATASTGSTASWTTCTGTASGNGTSTATCTYNSLDGTKTAAATFTSQSCGNLPVRINGGTPGYSSLQAAYNAASDGALIQAQAQTFTENLSVNRNISVTLQGGYDCAFSTYSGNTTSLKGSLTTTVGGGTLTLRNFILQQ